MLGVILCCKLYRGHSTTDCTSLATYKLIWNLIVPKKLTEKVVQNTLFLYLGMCHHWIYGTILKGKMQSHSVIAIQEVASFANIHEDIVNQSIMHAQGSTLACYTG